MPFNLDKDKSLIRILVIEDEEYSRTCISDFLELVGFSSIQASNGREGIELFGRYEPDVIITDIKMPEMDGIDILKFLQTYSAETPVIVISGTESLDDVADCLKYGAWDYIVKPVYDYGVVEMSILRVLEKKQLINENRRYRDYLEDEVIKRSDELLSSTVRFQKLFNLAGDVLFIHDRDGKILDCNEMAFKHIGYSRKQIMGMSMQNIIAPEDIPLFMQVMARLPHKNSIMYDLRFTLRSGVIAIMELHATMITAESAPLVFVICRDITERRRMEQERQELKKQIAAAHKMELVGLLASGIAHDFNNVLTALTGYASLLQSDLADENNPASQYALKIADIAAKGQALTGRLMSFIRKRRTDFVDVDIHKALRETEQMLRPNSKSIKIRLQLDAFNYHVLGDEAQIQSAFLNLGLNARDAMPNGGELTFSTINEDSGPGKGSIRISVTDTGGGIDKKIVDRIFDPLFTTKSDKGTGLGLPGVLSCVKHLHGTIDVSSEAGRGTTFKISLPLHDKNAWKEVDLTGKQVLVITDDFETAAMVGEKLVPEGISAQHFVDPEAALEWFRENTGNTAAIMIDLDLPKFDEDSFADDVDSIVPSEFIIKILSRDQISLSSNKDYMAFINTPINSDRFFESLAMYIRDNMNTGTDKK